jgi:hypothetical protein
MKDHRFSSRCVTPASVSISVVVGVGVLSSVLCMTALGAEAALPPMVSESPSPVPTEAEAPYQDSKGYSRSNRWLDEAIFTEISPVTAPEVGVALPDDQDH